MAGREGVIVTTDTARDVDRAIVARLSALPEPAALSYFWIMLHRGAPRLPLLLQLSQVVIVRPATWNIEAIRQEHERRVAAKAIAITSDACAGCESRQWPRELHHVIEIQNGGSNSPRNLVSLCHSCHQYLHPWLADPPPQRREGFESLWQVFDRNKEQSQ